MASAGLLAAQVSSAGYPLFTDNALCFLRELHFAALLLYWWSIFWAAFLVVPGWAMNAQPVLGLADWILLFSAATSSFAIGELGV